MSPDKKALLVGLGLVFNSAIWAVLLSMIRGGFKMGSLKRRVDFTMERDQMGAFLETFYRRVAELDFQPGENPGQFRQGGGAGAGSGTSTHAKTKKELLIAVDDQSDPARAELTLRYLDPIFGDTGESAYRDAILDYVAGQTNEMQIVTNRSFAAFSTFVGGIWAWIALIVLRVIDFDPLWMPIVIAGATDASMGIMAIQAIEKNPRELTGTGLAIAGIVTSGCAAIFSVVLAVLKHV